MLVSNGDEVEAGTSLAMLPATKKTKTSKKLSEKTEAITANVGGTVEVHKNRISITWADEEEREHLVPVSARLLVQAKDVVKAGDAITAGPLNPHDILRIKGKEEVHRYLVQEVQKVYRSQGVSIHDRHIEVVIRQMLRRVQIDSSGDAEYIPGQMVDLFAFQTKNAEVLAAGGDPATAKTVLLGITRSSLMTDSFLAAASFQETTRVLTEAAASGAQDNLLGLKENVIIGRLIPARTQMELPVMEREFISGEELFLQGVAETFFHESWPSIGSDSELSDKEKNPLRDSSQNREVSNQQEDLETYEEEA